MPLSSQDERPAGQDGFNPDPFHAGDNSEVGDWAAIVASADAPSSHRAAGPAAADDKPSPSNLDKTTTREHLNPLDAVKTATHTARRKLHLDNIQATGPSKRFNPTSVRVHLTWDDAAPSTGSVTHERALLWRARDNRKGRNSVAVPTSAVGAPSTPLRVRATRSARSIASNVFKMFTSFPYWDMAFWSGWAYTWGSVLFVMDGSWAWREVAFPGIDPESLSTYGGPLSFFFGALLYELGAVTAYLEAINDGSFQGSAMRRFLEGHEQDSKKMLDAKIHNFFGHFVPHHHHQDTDAEKQVDPEAGWRTRDRRERPGSIYPRGKAPAPRRGGIDLGEAEDKDKGSIYASWRWYPTWHALRTHHIYDIGYLACAIQMFGATLYGITGVVVLPGVLSSLEPWQEEGAFWGPQVVASCCFLTAAILFTLETQDKWWRPEPTVLGWWIGVWAAIGSIGFLLISIFGAASFDIEWGEYQADLATIWGSGAYLTSSLLQWYEATNKRPVEELFNEPGALKSSQIHPV